MEIEILHEERLRAWCALIDLPEAAVAELAAVAQKVRTEERLGAIFATFHEKTALRGEWQRTWTDLPVDPEVQAALGRQATLFYLLAYLAALPYTEREYRQRGIDPAILRATLLDIRTWLVHEYDLNGTWTFRQFMWIWRHITCKLFRLGRLQFVLEPFESGVTALRRRADGEICLLADPDLPLRADGYALNAGRSRPGEPFYRAWDPAIEETAWQPPFAARADGWQGCRISPYGQVLKESIFLPADAWEVVLQRGDTVLDLHIPRKDPFTVADCRDSLARAVDFFKTYFPERPFQATYCHTWFFTPQLQRLLPPESNIVRFQREFNLLPYLGGGPAFLWSYVFGEKVASLASAPRDTALRRAVLDWLENGGELFDLAGVMFHGPQEWGNQPALRRWDGKI